MVHIVIDGYNYMMRTVASRVQNGANLDVLRRGVLEKLSRYKRRKGSKVTIVFDAYNSMSPGRQRESYLGVDVVYSKENETADDVIIGWIRERRAGMVVVTSDRAIIDEAKRAGVAFITPKALEEMIADGMTGKDEGSDDEEEISPRKKGNPRKLPKKLRKATKAILKIS
ncbi:MAG: NYN domain-containing protein [Syntrophobacterales bacterium]|jgi:predicted RNA-binding protein with PIN domain|nr:NYN domain-containing protein [Syntrophobacterales bacterium]